MTNKPFKTITQQIAILRDQRHLIFLNEESAKQSLMRYGYYEIINGYKDNFMIDPEDDTKGFVSGATFEHIYALFNLDRKLSEAVLSGLADVEATLKTAIAYTIGATIGVDQNLYTDKSIYAIGDLHKKKKQDGTPVSDRDILLRTFKHTLNSKEQPFSHYRNDLGNIPPWIMVKNFSLGSVIYWYRLLPQNIKVKIQSTMFGIDEDVLAASQDSLMINQAFGDLLWLCLEYRNLCAHGGRVYNHRNNYRKLAYTPFIFQNQRSGITVSKNQYAHGMLNSSLGALILGLQRLANSGGYMTICSWMDVWVADYLKAYPDDYEFLSNSMEIEGMAVEQLLHKHE